MEKKKLSKPEKKQKQNIRVLAYEDQNNRRCSGGQNGTCGFNW